MGGECLSTYYVGVWQRCANTHCLKDSHMNNTHKNVHTPKCTSVNTNKRIRSGIRARHGVK